MCKIQKEINRMQLLALVREKKNPIELESENLSLVPILACLYFNTILKKSLNVVCAFFRFAFTSYTQHGIIYSHILPKCDMHFEFTNK